MSRLINEYKRLVQSPTFKEWHSANKEAYLYMVFSMFEVEPVIEFSFIEPKKKEVTSFTIQEEVKLKAKESVEWERAPKRLDLEEVKVELREAIDRAIGVQQQYYTGESPLKKIVSLQYINDTLVWNITFLTSSFSILNIKLNAVTKELVSHTLRKLFDFAQ